MFSDSWICPWPVGGGHSGTEWLATAKQLHRVKAVNAKTRSGPLKVKKGGGQLQTNNLIRVVSSKVCLFSLYFLKYKTFIT